MENNIEKIFLEHIKGTEQEEIVVDLVLYLTNLTIATKNGCGLNSLKVHITTKVIKHLYDRKPAEEFDAILRNLTKIVRYPDQAYANLDSKRGSICFLKEIDKQKYFCPIETKVIEDGGTPEEVNDVVTCFRIRDENYLKNYGRQ